jgi:outer membrane protein
MRRAVTVVAWLGLAVAGPIAAGAQTPPAIKIGFINSRTILQATPGYQAAESTFNKEVQGFKAEVQRLQQQLDSAVRALDQQSIALSPAAKQAKQRELQQMEQHFQQRSSELQDKATQRERELLQPIQARVNGVIQGIRAEANYQFIFDADAPGNNIVAADPTLDITSKVIDRLKASQ